MYIIRHTSTDSQWRLDIFIKYLLFKNVVYRNGLTDGDKNITILDFMSTLRLHVWIKNTSTFLIVYEFNLYNTFKRIIVV